MARRLQLRGRLRSRSGSAYIVTLLALVVLTILALSLSLITQTEMRIGANEVTVQRVFYAADSGIAASTARALVSGDHSSLSFSVDDPIVKPLGLQQQVDVSPFLPIGAGYCNLCSINQGSDFYQINHAVTASAIRQGIDLGGNPFELAAKAVTVMVEVQPWERRIVSLSPEEIAKVKF